MQVGCTYLAPAASCMLYIVRVTCWLAGCCGLHTHLQFTGCRSRGDVLFAARSAKWDLLQHSWPIHKRPATVRPVVSGRVITTAAAAAAAAIGLPWAQQLLAGCTPTRQKPAEQTGEHWQLIHKTSSEACITSAHHTGPAGGLHTCQQHPLPCTCASCRASCIARVSLFTRK
jgi:hypothetical protein